MFGYLSSSLVLGSDSARFLQSRPSWARAASHRTCPGACDGRATFFGLRDLGNRHAQRIPPLVDRPASGCCPSPDMSARKLFVPKRRYNALDAGRDTLELGGAGGEGSDEDVFDRIPAPRAVKDDVRTPASPRNDQLVDTFDEIPMPRSSTVGRLSPQEATGSRASATLSRPHRWS